MDLRGCTALITGASAGLGEEFARQLAPRAGSLVLVARRREKLEQLRDELTKRDPNLKVHVRTVDLLDPQDVHALCDWLEEKQIAINFLINNAGIGDHGPFLTSDLQRVNGMLQLNIVALTMLTRRLLPAMVAQQQRGAILNVSSSASFLPLPELAVYSATKAFVSSFSEALRIEVRGSGVSVTALCPGPVHTEFNDIATRAGEKRKSAPEISYVSAQEVVRVALRAVERDQPLVVPGVVMKLAMLLVRMTPLPILRLALRAGR